VQILLVIVVILLIGAGRVGYFYWGALGAWISCIVALVLPLGTFLAYLMSLDDPPKKESPKGSHSGSRTQGDSSSTYRRASCQRTNSASSHKRFDWDESTSPFLRCLAGLMAKIAKADGRVDESEISAAETVFTNLGLTPLQRKFCIINFREALSPFPNAAFYARILCATCDNYEIRRLVYSILWDIACADGSVTAEELSLLKSIAPKLRLVDGIFDQFYSERVASSGNRRSQDGQRTSSTGNNELKSAYDELGCSDELSDDELRAHYRGLAKRLHPDVLRAQGMPESLMVRANERMAKINSAWEVIKRSRGIRA